MKIVILGVCGFIGTNIVNEAIRLADINDAMSAF